MTNNAIRLRLDATIYPFLQDRDDLGFVRKQVRTLCACFAAKAWELFLDNSLPDRLHYQYTAVCSWRIARSTASHCSLLIIA
jgi:hypothetical protein